MLRTISASDKCVDFAVASVSDFQHFRAPANSSTAGGFVEYGYTGLRKVGIDTCSSSNNRKLRLSYKCT